MLKARVTQPRVPVTVRVAAKANVERTISNVGVRDGVQWELGSEGDGGSGLPPRRGCAVMRDLAQVAPASNLGVQVRAATLAATEGASCFDRGRRRRLHATSSASNGRGLRTRSNPRGIFPVVALVALTIVTACNRAAPRKESLGDAKVTLEYWNAIHEPIPEYDGERVLRTVAPLNPDRASQQYITSCLRGCAAIVRARSEQLARMPVHRVDADAAAYAVEFVKLRQDTASFVESLAQLMDDPTGLPDGGTFLLGFLLRLGQHANDPENAFWSATKDQLVASSNDVGQAMSRGRALQQQFLDLDTRMKSMTTSEMAVRVKLAQRYDREFPAHAPDEAKPITVDSGSSGCPRSTGELQRDLLGHQIQDGWTFATLGEFRALEVTGSVTSGNLAVVEVTTAVKGAFSGAEHTYKLRLIYQRGDNGWQLAVVEQRPG